MDEIARPVPTLDPLAGAPLPEALTHAFLSAAPAPADGFYRLGRDWRFLSANRQALEYLGATEAEAIGRTLWELAPGLAGTVCEAHYREAMELGEPREFVGPSAARPGRWLEARAFPADGGLDVYLRDITERVSLEARLARSEERLRLAQEAGEIGLWDWDVASGEVFWSENYYGIWGIDRGVTPSLHGFLGSVHPAQREEVRRDLEAAQAAGGRWLAEIRVADDAAGERWVSARGEFRRGADGRVQRMIGVCFDISERKRAEERQRLLVNELNHRVKNTLAIVQSLAARSLRADADLGEARAGFEARLLALAAAHDVLTRESWEGAALSAIAAETLAPFRGPGGRRIAIRGPELTLAPETGVTFALALHELATNAAKYGALSRDGGSVTLAWEIADARLRLRWTEQGGPAVAAPARAGFGTRMIERALAAELHGEVAIDFAPAGLVCRVEAPWPQPSRRPG